MLARPFLGADETVAVFQVVIDTLAEFTIVDEFTSGFGHAFHWRARVRTTSIEGVDVFRRDRHGLIDEIRVFIRPLPASAAFMAAIGPPLARQRRSRLSFAAGPMGGALPPLFKTISAVGTRVLGLRPSRPTNSIHRRNAL